MKIARYAADSGESWGVLTETELIDVPLLADRLAQPCPVGPSDAIAQDRLSWLQDLIHDGDQESIRTAAVPLSTVRLRAPLDRPGKVVGIGRNYLDHASEASLKLPKWPKLFPKFPSTIIGTGDPIVRPTMTTQLDFEVEVAVVIGKTAQQVPEQSAMDYVAGYTVLNDVSARDLQFMDEQITLGKNFDTFCPLGPVIATKADLPDPRDIDLSLHLNGHLMQRSSTRNLIFSIPYLVAFVSYATTLEPGDVISTGTPSGVGCFRDPPVWLKPGDVVEATVEGIGTLVNTVTEGTGEAPSPARPPGASQPSPS